MKKYFPFIALAFVIVLGIALTVYPAVSNFYNQRHQSEIHAQYQQEIEQADDTAILEAKERAASYNEAILQSVGELYSQEVLAAALEGYADQLDLIGNGIMGYVKIPTIGVKLPIYHGTEAATLEIGAGHLLGSSLPVGGESTHTILTGHSGMASQKMFSDLPQLKIGDVFYLEILDETLAYQVDQIETVLPYETELLGITPGEDYCTLVTCTPFGVNTHRLLVRGCRIPHEKTEVVEVEKAEAVRPTISTWEQEYIRGIWMGVGSVAIIGIAALAIRLYRRYFCD